MLRRLGPLFCQHGLMGVLRHLGKTAVAILKEAKETISGISLPSISEIPGLAKTAAKRFFRMFWTMLKETGKAMVKGFKAIFEEINGQAAKKNTAAQEEQLRVQMC